MMSRKRKRATNVQAVSNDVVVISVSGADAKAMCLALTYLIMTTERRDTRMRLVSEENPEIFGDQHSGLLDALVVARSNLQRAMEKTG
jgi:hypothetical protein